MILQLTCILSTLWYPIHLLTGLCFTHLHILFIWNSYFSFLNMSVCTLRVVVQTLEHYGTFNVDLITTCPLKTTTSIGYPTQNVMNPVCCTVRPWRQALYWRWRIEHWTVPRVTTMESVSPVNARFVKLKDSWAKLDTFSIMVHVHILMKTLVYDVSYYDLIFLELVHTWWYIRTRASVLNTSVKPVTSVRCYNE